MSSSLCAFPQLCFNYPNSPVGLAVELLPGTNTIDFSENHLKLQVDARIILNQGSDLLMDFELIGLLADTQLFASPDFSIQGNMTNLRFSDAKVVNPGTVVSNPRDIWQFSYDFDDFQAFFNSWLFSDKIRIKNLGPLFFSVFDL